MPGFRIATIALGMTLAVPALATPNLVADGSFEGSTVTAKSQFTNSNVPGWSIVNSNSLTFIDTPGSASNGTYLSVYSGFPNTSPDGGKFVEADGDPNYSSWIYQTVSGLTVGQNYLLSFYQAASEQDGFTSPTGYTTSQWEVYFGTSTTPNNVQYSALMTTPTGSYTPWQQVTMNFTATAASEFLAFLAVGTPSGAPPIGFLDGVSMTASVPEPLSLSLLGVGLLGTVAARHRCRNQAGRSRTA